MTKRVEPRPADVEAVLDSSRRRCCLCAYLEGDWRQKKGQIAHVDRNPCNSTLENLAFLCLDHHSEHDSKTSQRRGYQPEEVRRYRERLYSEVAEIIARGVQMADEAAVTPYVIVVGAGISALEARVMLRNYSQTPGLVTEVTICEGAGEYRWTGKLVIEGNGTVKGFHIARSGDADPPAIPGKPTFEVEVCDLGEGVPRRRSGFASQVLA